ncbi:MAG: hypothetical protein DWQ49_13965 [Bacteroidetes bacterium]|nr:MAG: hypothetical protein DWQ49_13965 [Bacteroidota bacterium]|tara:strand:- start:152 stop:439 length:288 start_codon:yes stop_codon:yes gene_type:complete
MLRIALAEGIAERIDLGIVGPGKIFLYNTGTEDIRVAYDSFDVSTSGSNYFTLLGGSQYVFDVGPGIGFLAQNQQLFFVSPTGSNTLEVWVADNQ